MATPNTISLLYYGGDADENRLNFYDASASYEGASRTFAIIGHYYIRQKIIVKSPHSAMPLFIVPPEEGSLKQNIIAGVVGGLIVMGVNVPFTTLTTRLIDSWIPPPTDPDMSQVIQLLEEQNNLLRRQMGMPKERTDEDVIQQEAADKFLKENEKDLQIVRSVVSQSFKKIFRPISTGSAKQIGLVGGGGDAPSRAVDRDVLNRIEADDIDDDEVIVMGVVNSFSRSSKKGIVYSRDYMSGFRVEYTFKGRLPREDDFSWSQYSGKPIRMYGRFVRFFDGKIKKMLVNSVERVTDEGDIADYFDNAREVRQF